MTLRQLTHRAALPGLLHELGLTTLGVEVGVWRGQHASDILAYWPGKLYGVDPYWYQPDWRDLLNESQAVFDEARALAAAMLGVYGERYELVPLPSVTVAAWFAQRFGPVFDFVYLDGRHDGPSITADLAAWAPLVKPGGLFAGHDYVDRDPADRSDMAVKPAVDAFVRDRGLELQVTTMETYPTWYVQMPGGK